MKNGSPRKTRKLTAAKQRQLDVLLDKNSEGTISAHERIRLRALVEEAERLMIANAKSLARLSTGQSPRVAAQRVPVTVWIQPELPNR